MRKETALSVAPSLPRQEPDVCPLHQKAVLKALRWAWDLLLQRRADLLSQGDEESITLALQELLNERTDGRRAAHWLQDFENVARGERQKATLAGINKQPDLSFRPIPYPTVTNTTRWGWFVECKILSARHPLGDYVSKGVCRFFDGNYAVAMPSAAMTAYVRDGGWPADRLRPALFGKVGTISVTTEASLDQCRSIHDRSAISLQPICIIHLWLHCDESFA